VTERESDATNAKGSTGGRFWTAVRIVNVRLRFVFLMLAVGLVAGYWENLANYWDRWTRPASAVAAVSADTEYYCPMHPNIVRSEPGSCPICGMPLSKRAKGEKPPLPEGVLAQVQMTPQKVRLGRIGASPVEYRLLSREIRTVGIVGYDETRLAHIAARIKGRLETLFVNYVGEHVTQGAPLAAIYSPDLLVAQEELLTSIRSAEQNKSVDFAGAAAQSMVDAARKKLLLWGITEDQIAQIIKRGKPDNVLTIYSPISGIVTEKNVLQGHYVDEGTDLYTIADLSRVWMQVKVFEDQVQGVQLGTAVEVTSTADPQETFAGRITFIAYTVDPGTRTVSARVEIDNPDLKLKPGMYASAVIRTPVGRVVPVSAVVPVAAKDNAAGGLRAGRSAASRPASAAPVDTTELVKAYLKLTASFASDKQDASALKSLKESAEKLAKSDDESVRKAATGIAARAGEMTGKGLKLQQGTLKQLSAQLIPLVRAHPPAGMALNVVYCPMAKAEWLQTSEEIRNPYYGSEMLECGTIKSTIKAASQPASGPATEPAPHHDHSAKPQAALESGGSENAQGVGVTEGEEGARFATGYFCPITPDRLYATSQQCPVDKFPTKLVQIEKVLAVPTSAIIDTGTRQVVYRESAPGTFEMLDVKLGARAGDYYPVLSGLTAGDQVATEGAFLVDAENRLNPAAGAQYFGASGGPTGEHAH
jgi:membrane fusion protein, copper/silver efflux system